jgi:hypothetical protein
MEVEKKSENEERIRAITKIYYSNPSLQKYIAEFSKDREVVPRYFEGFGKRPDTIMYVSDVMGLVKRGATSFHCSEELWFNALNLSSEITTNEMNTLRKGWDLLIDVDSPFLDCSKKATELIIVALEQHGIKNYGIKFSGNKGFHIIVGSNAFPKEYNGIETKKMFPEWARIICSYLMSYIRRDYNRAVSEMMLDLDALSKRTKINKEKLQEICCLKCGRVAKKSKLGIFKCNICNTIVEKKDYKNSKRRLKCINSDCAGILELLQEKEYHYCEYDTDPDNKNIQLMSDKHPELFEENNGISAEKIANLDLVLVAPRHLFRMPYSLHEKTTLSSVVIKKQEIQNFTPKEANPLSIELKDFIPKYETEEAKMLLHNALDWNRGRENEKEVEKKRDYTPIEINNKQITDDMYPVPIKKILKGLTDGKKRGLFVLITFFRALNYSEQQTISKIDDWNKLNQPGLRESYIKGQITWHFKQKKKILPPNYENDAFYKDLGVLENKQNYKNPLSEILSRLKRMN